MGSDENLDGRRVWTDSRQCWILRKVVHTGEPTGSPLEEGCGDRSAVSL